MIPTISINISCYNRSQMLKECIESFLKQSFSSFEIIIVDDGSEEDLRFVSKLDDRVKYYWQEHGGMAKGLNLAADKSVGWYIMPFGSDDIASDKEFLSEMIIPLEILPACDVVYCDHWLMDGSGRLKRTKYANMGHIPYKILYQEMLKKQLIAHGGTLWRKEKMPRYDLSVAPADDWDLFLTAIENGLIFHHIPKRLWTYKIGHQRMSESKEMKGACRKVLAKRGIII